MKRIPEEGVTAILPTTVTQMPDVLTAAVANVAEVVREGYEGAVPDVPESGQWPDPLYHIGTGA